MIVQSPTINGMHNFILFVVLGRQMLREQENPSYLICKLVGLELKSYLKDNPVEGQCMGFFNRTIIF